MHVSIHTQKKVENGIVGLVTIVIQNTKGGFAVVRVKIQIDLERGVSPGPMSMGNYRAQEGSLLPYGWPVGQGGQLSPWTHLPGLSSPLRWTSPSPPLNRARPPEEFSMPGNPGTLGAARQVTQILGKQESGSFIHDNP